MCGDAGVITKAVHKSSEEEKKEEEVKKTLEQHDSIVTQYKELIREQVQWLALPPLADWMKNNQEAGLMFPKFHLQILCAR